MINNSIDKDNNNKKIDKNSPTTTTSTTSTLQQLQTQQEDGIYCTVHYKKFKLICSTCLTMVCTRCTTTDHRNHVFDDEHSIVSKINHNTIEELWKTLKTYHRMKVQLDHTHQKVVDFYNNLHQFLMTEELKLNNTVQSQNDKINMNIENIINQIKLILRLKNTPQQQPIQHINKAKEKEIEKDKEDKVEGEKEFFNKLISIVERKCIVEEEDEENNNNNIENEDDYSKLISKSMHSRESIDISKVINSLQSSTSIEEFVLQNYYLFNFKDIFDNSNNINSDNTNNNRIVKEVYQYKKLLFEMNETIPANMELLFNYAQLGSLKNEMKQLYEFRDYTNRKPLEIIFSVSRSSIEDKTFNVLLSSPKSLKTTDATIKYGKKKETVGIEITNVLNSVVLVPEIGEVFVFGGNPSSKSYFSFDLRQRGLVIINQSEFETNQGGEGIAACFDGTHIYLVGGRKLQGKKLYALSRVDRYDIATKAIDRIAQLNDRIFNAFTFVRWGILYVVGGNNGEGDLLKISTFNISTNEIDTYTDDVSTLPVVKNNYHEHQHVQELLEIAALKRIVSCCYDQRDSIYMFIGYKFYRLNLLDKTMVALARPQDFFTVQPHTLVFLGSNGYTERAPVIYDMLIGQRYSIESNKWEIIETGSKLDKEFSIPIFKTIAIETCFQDNKLQI